MARAVDEKEEAAAVRAYRVLERMIVTLELPPSGMTTEKTLIERVAIGRTPVREAIQRLAWEGLIEIRPRSGLAIAPLQAADWPLVIDARSGVEVVLARAAARNVRPEATGALQDAARSMSEAVGQGSVIAFLEADKRLDEIMGDMAGNIFAARVAAPLQTHSRRFWYRYQSDTSLAQSAEHHVKLIRAILGGDEWQSGREAERLMAMLRQLAVKAASR